MEVCASLAKMCKTMSWKISTRSCKLLQIENLFSELVVAFKIRFSSVKMVRPPQVTSGKL